MWFPTTKTPVLDQKSKFLMATLPQLANGRGVLMGKIGDFPELSAFYLLPIFKVGGYVGVKLAFPAPPIT